MLILTRAVGQTVHIGDDITVTVTGVIDGQVRLGITAPRTLPVHRKEIYEQIRREQRALEAAR